MHPHRAAFAASTIDIHSPRKAQDDHYVAHAVVVEFVSEGFELFGVRSVTKRGGGFAHH
jgi:hypothetical protein